MKIALIVEHCHKRGGHERYTAELAEHLSCKHEVHVFANTWEGVNGPVNFHRVPMARKPTLLMLWTFKRNVRRMIKRHGPFNIVHSQGANSLVQNIATNHTSQKARLEAMGPLGQTDRSALGRLHDRIFWNYVIKAEDRLYKRGTKVRVIAVSQGVKKEMQRHYGISPANIRVIVNGVDLERFNPDRRKDWRSRWRNQHGFLPSDFILLFIGGDWERKRLNLSIESLSLLKKDNVKLAVVGKWHREPSYRQMAERLGVGSRVFFCGPSSCPEEAYAGSDLFVFPSSYEACSLSVLEAMASGLPIIMPRINGWDEQLQEGKNGFTIEPNPQSLADKIRLLVADNRLCAAMGKHSNEMAEQYSWGNCVGQTEQYYETIESIVC